MNEEQNIQNENEQIVENKSDWKEPLCKVTPFSKYLAMVLFIALPFIGFWLGMGYGKLQYNSVDTIQQINSTSEQEILYETGLDKADDKVGHPKETLKDEIVPYFSHTDFVTEKSHVTQKGVTFFMNDAGELVRQEVDGQQTALVMQDIDIVTATTTWGEPHTYSKGAVLNFWVSPDEQHIAYVIQDGGDACCGARAPVRSSMRLMTMDTHGLGKILVDVTPHNGSQIRMAGWLYDSKYFVFYDQHLDEATQGSLFYQGEVGTSTIAVFEGFTYSDIELEHHITGIAGASPHFSPTGDVMVYRKGGMFGTDIILSHIDGSEKKTILEVPEYKQVEIKWAENGKVFTVTISSTGELFFFNEQGDVLNSDVQ